MEPITDSSVTGNVTKNLLNDKKKHVKFTDRQNTCCTSLFLIFGVFNIVLGVLAIHYDLLKLIIEERIRMRPGLPPLEWWKSPPVDVRLSVYIYSVTNSQEFLNGIDKKLKLKEVGPIVYREIVRQEDIVFHDNSTMSYTTTYRNDFLPEDNPSGILDEVITVPNSVLLGMAGSLFDASVLKRIPFNIMSRKDEVFRNETVYNLLWNFSTPVLELAKDLIPFMVPRSNGGILYNINYSNKNRFNVKIGDKYGFENFFKINSYNGDTKIPGFEYETRESCPISLVNATDATSYSPYLTKQSVLNVWRINTCATLPFTFEKEVKKGIIDAYKFVIREDVFDRIDDLSEDCHKGFHGNILPDGLSDFSKCAFGTPSAVSSPHFLGRSGSWEQDVEGINPNKDKHSSYTIVEPKTGIILEQAARLQNNLVMPSLRGFNADVQKFSGKIIPLFWAEFKLANLTPTMTFIVYFVVNVIPAMQPIISIFLLVLGICIILIVALRCYSLNTLRIFYRKPPKKNILLDVNFTFKRETEELLNKKL